LSGGAGGFLVCHAVCLSGGRIRPQTWPLQGYASLTDAGAPARHFTRAASSLRSFATFFICPA
jgi:hypothetical protein